MAKFTSQQHTARPGIEIVYGSSVMLMGSNGTRLFQIDFEDTEQDTKSIEFQVLDETGTPLHSIEVRATGLGAEEAEQE